MSGYGTEAGEVFFISHRQNRDHVDAKCQLEKESMSMSKMGVEHEAMLENGVYMVKDQEKSDEVHSLEETKFEFSLASDVKSSNTERETWSNQCGFLLSIIGFAVDLANVWRFPYFCYKNGGGAFLIPYFMILIIVVVPQFYAELLIGQYHRQGAISMWKIAPIFKGVGWTIVSVSFLVSFYYNTIIGWSIFYFFSSFTRKLPWTSCTNEWNTCRCYEGLHDRNVTSTRIVCGNITLNSTQTVSPTQEYFERGMLRIHESDGFHDVGIPQWDITLCLLLAYITLYFALRKGVKSSGKFISSSTVIISQQYNVVRLTGFFLRQTFFAQNFRMVVYVTVLAPYIILLILLIRGAFLDGAIEGLYYFANPKFERLTDSRVWCEAAFQVFYSVGAGFGVHLSMASYNKFNNNCYRDCLITVVANSFTSLFSGCVVFVFLGYMSVKMGKDIEDVASQGPSLVFEVYPQAIATLPGSTAWSLIFFFMLIMLGMDSSMGGLESVITAILDEFKGVKKFKYHREICTGIVVFTSFCVALASVTNGGLFIVNLLDNFAAATSLLLVVFFQSVAVAWFYGLDQFLRDAKCMLGFTPGLYWCVCWKFLNPAALVALVVASVVTYEPLSTELSDRKVEYPLWINTFGWTMVVICFLWVPAFIIYTLLIKTAKYPWKQRLAMAISPEHEHKSIIEGKPVSRFEAKHWLFLTERIRWLPKDQTVTSNPMHQLYN